MEGKIGVFSVSSLFLTRVGVYLGVCVCICTHTHTAQIRYSDVSPGVGMIHLEGPKNLDGLNLGIYRFVYVYKVHMCMNMLGCNNDIGGFHENLVTFKHPKFPEFEWAQKMCLKECSS